MCIICIFQFTWWTFLLIYHNYTFVAFYKRRISEKNICEQLFNHCIISELNALRGNSLHREHSDTLCELPRSSVGGRYDRYQSPRDKMIIRGTHTGESYISLMRARVYPLKEKNGAFVRESRPTVSR